MKAIIENHLYLSITQGGDQTGVLNAFTNEMLQSFNSIITMITIAENEDVLRTLIANIFAQGQAVKYFHYGFGANHFWVK